MSRTLIAMIRLYRMFSPFKRRCCRFVPTCSAYAIEAITVHGVYRGLLMSLGRILRCRPGSDFGYDPVPPKSIKPCSAQVHALIHVTIHKKV